MARSAWGSGIATLNGTGSRLDVYFTELGIGTTASSSADLASAPSGTRSGRSEFCSVTISDLDEAPGDVGDAYLRLHLLSHRLVRPNEMNLTGIFSVLPNVCWTSRGAIDPSEIQAMQVEARNEGSFIAVRSVDKFPRMLDYVVPSGVRIADSSRVRLGAYLSEGTTVMPAGFVNFNAGTLGSAMVEGRISQGVVVGADSDIGGGASIMGTLSGGGTERVMIGERCLLGANSGLGVSLGDDCVVEAGLYLTAGTVVTLLDGSRRKARELSGKSGLLFRRNSVTGTVEAHERSGFGIALNEELHVNI